MRFLFVLLPAILFGIRSNAQAYYLLEPEAISKANVDSCKVFTAWRKSPSDSANINLDKKFSFSKKGFITTETSLYTDYYISTDSVIPIMQTVEWHFTEEGLVSHKNQTVWCVEDSSFNRDREILEIYGYDFNDNLVSVAFFEVGQIEKVLLKSYNDNKLLIEEQKVYPNEVFSRSSFSQSRQITYSYEDGKEVSKTYDKAGVLLDSIILIIDSVELVKTYYDYNFRKNRRLPSNPHIYKQIYDHTWKLLNITHWMVEELISKRDYFYDSNGLLLKIVSKEGDFEVSEIYEYFYREM